VIDAETNVPWLASKGDHFFRASLEYKRTIHRTPWSFWYELEIRYRATLSPPEQFVLSVYWDIPSDCPGRDYKIRISYPYAEGLPPLNEPAISVLYVHQTQ